jgi:hypothetical protein
MVVNILDAFVEIIMTYALFRFVPKETISSKKNVSELQFSLQYNRKASFGQFKNKKQHLILELEEILERERELYEINLEIVKMLCF